MIGNGMVTTEIDLGGTFNHQTMAAYGNSSKTLQKQFADLQEQYEAKCNSYTKLQSKFKEAQGNLGQLSDKLKKLQTENEQVYQDFQSIKVSQAQATALNEEAYRKKIKRLTGEVDMFDAYTDSLYDIFFKMPSAKQAQNCRTEITKIRDTFK